MSVTVRLLGAAGTVTGSGDAFSAHADQPSTLRWLGGFTRPPAMTCLLHGEPRACAALACAMEHELGWAVRVAEDGSQVSV